MSKRKFKNFVSIDVEADGPIPGEYSMVSLGAVQICPAQNNKIVVEKSFYRQLSPISDKYSPEALKVTGFSREETLNFSDPKNVMEDFKNWVVGIYNPIFIADNTGFDWQFINWYFHYFIGNNPFGHSSTDIGSLYKGLNNNFKTSYQRFRKKVAKTEHTHNALDDAIGNAEAFKCLLDNGELKI